MRYSQSEKMEIISIVENSELSVKQTLEELDIIDDYEVVENVVFSVASLGYVWMRFWIGTRNKM